MISVRSPITHSALSPVGYSGFRWATQIDPIWNAYFLGATLSLAAGIEAKRIPVDQEVVFSHRFDPNDSGHLFDRSGWKKFQERSVHLAERYNYVVSVDIADFYGRVYHHRIENELKYIDKGGQVAGEIMSLLSEFSKGVSYGLPVGGPAARMLSELILNAVDQLLLVHDPAFAYIRYADDYRFFVDDLESAHRAIGFLSEKLQRNEGLSLQRSKTRIMTASEFLSTVRPPDPRPGSAAKFLSLHLYYDPYSATADEDYEELREQISEFDVLGLLRAELFKGRVDQALTKKLVSALKLMQPIPKEQAIRSLLENIETLAPVFPYVMRAVRDNVKDLSDEAQDEVHASLRGMVRDRHHLAQVDVNLAYIIRVLSQKSDRENTDLLIRLFGQNHGYAGASAPNIQRDIMLALGRWETQFWLHDRKPHYSAMHEWVARAFFISSYALGDEGRHWRQSVKSSLSPFDKIVSQWISEKVQQSGWEIPV
ncbi:MAG: RNA-directed DNA polymerase [Nocardioides sp.]